MSLRGAPIVKLYTRTLEMLFEGIDDEEIRRFLPAVIEQLNNKKAVWRLGLPPPAYSL